MVRESRIKTYEFPAGSLVGAGASGNFVLYTDWSLNGRLQAVQVKANNFSAANGKLILQVSGTGEIIWQLASGTNTGTVAQSGVYFPRGHARTTDNISLATSGIYAEIPLFGNYMLTGSEVGKGKSGTGFVMSYI